jgi:2-amino-4-hydroxy-6-hydroxymethyldihydropteridine diphosphokinase
MKNIYLGLGSNVGNRDENLRSAVHELGIKIISSSSIYETEPVEYLDQPWFLNCVVQIENDLRPYDLLQLCQKVETQLLRKREISKGPRTIDLDILFYGNLILQHPDLTIPHPAIQDRKFVLEPLNEIAPNFVHPLLKKTVSQLLAECTDQSVIRCLT